jgi:hypothetical protein
MKVRISAFQLTYHSKLNIDTLSVGLQKRQNLRLRWPPHERVLRVLQDGDFLLGSLLTDRGHRAFVAIDTESNALSRGRLAKGKNFGAFSFFVLCRRKPAAIITSYRDAGGASFIFGLLNQIAQEVLHEMRDKQIAAEGAGISAGRRKAINTAHRGVGLSWVEYLGRAEYDAVLRHWRSIKAIEVAYNAETAPAAYVPFDGEDVQTSQLRLIFKPKTVVSRAVDYLKRFRERHVDTSPQVLKVDGIDELGIPRKVEIQDQIPSLLGELDHDEVIGEPTSFAPDLRNSYVIRHLKHVIGDHPAIFG